MIGIGIGLPFIKFGGIDSQALAHFNRVIAYGGIIPAGLAGCDAWFKAAKAAYGVSDITAAISSGIDPHYLGYKLGAGSGATLGSAAQTCYNAIGAIGDVIQTTAASQPLILPHTGTNYVWLPGVNGNGFTSPHSVANNITENWEVIVQTKFSNSTALGCFLSKRAFGNSQYSIFKLSSGSIYISQSIGGVQLDGVYASNIGTSFNGFIKITRNAITGTILIYTSLDGISYTLQSTNAGPIGTLDVINTPIKIGAEATTLISPYQGEIYRLTISNAIGGSPVVDFNPASYNAATSQTQWTSTTGEVWTANSGTTTTGYKLAIVDSTLLMGDGIDDKLISSSLNFTAPTYMQVVCSVFPTSPGTTAICGGNNLNYYTQDGGLRRSVKDGNVQGDASGYTARILCLEGLQISRTASQFIFNRNNSNTLSQSIGGSPITDDSVISMFANLAGNLPSNCSIRSLIFSTYPNTTQRTSFYNFLRSINNNAF